MFRGGDFQHTQHIGIHKENYEFAIEPDTRSFGVCRFPSFVSVFLTVQLAVWRYIAVVHPWKQRNWCNKKITRNVIIAGYVVCCVLYAIPYHLSFDIETIDSNQNTHAHPYHKFTIDGHLIMYKLRYYIYGLVIRLFPSVVLVWLTFKIVVGLSARKRNHEQLTASASGPSSVKILEMKKQTNKSTVILLAVVVLFFTAEFPRGILWILGRFDEHNWETVYDSISQVFVTIDHINIAITFVVYYSLSQPFRTAFKSLFNCDTRTISHQTHTQLALGNTEETNSERRTFEMKRFSTTDNHLRYSTFLTVSQTKLDPKTPTETRKILDQNSAPSPRSTEC
ncbi:substance-K receptor-like [Planococcus citri]|uniref:substance-K receptor-like n=1 Tax=Planococcus citri TaxID=170843 RepID=UPI0031F75BB4